MLLGNAMHVALTCTRTRIRKGFNDWNEIAARYPKWKDGLNESDVIGIAEALVR